jgi:ribonuclease P/MRP protein subunit POP5
MRQRHRYIAFEVVGAGVDRSDLVKVFNSLSNKVRHPGDPVPRLALYDVSSGRGLLKCGHMQVDALKSAMAGIDRIRSKMVTLKILGASGTIRAAKRKFLTLPKQRII